MSGLVYKVPPRSRKQIRTLAEGVRALAKADTPCFDIMSFVEKALPTLSSSYVFLTADSEEMGSNHGLASPDDNYIKIRDDVYLGALAGKGRDRLTVAHELGHLLMHKGITFSRTHSSEIKTYENSEWQANAFAGELLMPVNIVIALNCPFEIMAKCSVSLDAATTQLNAVRREGLIK